MCYECTLLQRICLRSVSAIMDGTLLLLLLTIMLTLFQRMRNERIFLIRLCNDYHTLIIHFVIVIN